MSCLSWRGIFHGSWENKSKFQIGGLRETGGLHPFSPVRAHLLTTPKGQWYLPLASRALSEGDFAFCGKRQTMPPHLRALLSSSVRLEKYRRFNRRYFPTACANLPPAALTQIECRLNRHPFLFTKKKQKACAQEPPRGCRLRTPLTAERRTFGNLPSGGESS